MSKRFSQRALSLVTALTLVLAPFASSISLAAPNAAPEAPSTKPTADRLVFFASDGMRPDLMATYALSGTMPTYQQIISAGVTGNNGLIQGFPPNTGVGWYTLATGTWPSEHGSTNNTFFRAGDTYTNRTSFSASGVLQADTLAAAAERAGKKVAQVDWVGGINSGIAGPTVDFANFFSMRGVVVTPTVPQEQSGATTFGLAYEVVDMTPASGWTNEPLYDPVAPPMETALLVTSTITSTNPNRLYNLYIYDSISDTVAAYDTVILVSSTVTKNIALSSTVLIAGDFNEIKLVGGDGLIGSRVGQTAGFYTKLITLAPDLSAFKLYFTSVERVIASCNTAACNALPVGGTGENRLEKYLADTFPTYIAADFAPMEALIIDEDTYVEQGLDLHDAFSSAVLTYILGTLQPDTDLAFVGFPVTDEFQHQFMGLVTPTDMEGNPNPYYDDIDNNDILDGRLAIREGYIQSAYAGADAHLALARSLMGGNPATFASSDHGFAPQWYAVNARKVLSDTTVTFTSTPVSLHPSGATSVSNCSTNASTDYVKACWAGGTAQFYLNPALAPSGSATATTVINAVISAFTVLTDSVNPTATVVSTILTKSQLRNVDGSDSLHPNRSGDVVVVTRPPYQWDAATVGASIAFSQFFGQHGYLPNLVDIPHNVNMHGVFVAAGTGILSNTAPIDGVRAIDVAPTIAFLMGFAGPQNARGNILYNLFTDGGDWEEISLLNYSDFHGQLIPLVENPDPAIAAAALQPIGGAAFLKPWFDNYEAGASSPQTLRITSGDDVGATPPISAFFEDTPTIDIQNLMLLDYAGLGNHNFDRGQLYMRNTLIPRAQYQYLSANLVFPTLFMPLVGLNFPPAPLLGTENTVSSVNSLTSAPGFGYGWEPSVVITTSDGNHLALIGFSNDDLPSLTSPVLVAPVRVTSSTVAVQDEANRLIAQGADAVVAFGHLGADAGGITTPTGPLVNLATALTGVDVVIGDHTNFQVLTTTVNNVLVTENLSKGARFTRVRIVFDNTTHQVIYKTADFHKPWNIGVTADSAIQTEIDTLNAAIAGTLNVIVGNSNVYIPRADLCGRSDGRLCESRVGDVVTGALLWHYSTNFALTNSGGIRADLTCPTTDLATDNCPNYGGVAPYPISRGQVFTVLPFGNFGSTISMNGAELKTMLEQGVSSMPAANGKFAQVSGLCFTYNISGTAQVTVNGVVTVPGTRVLSAVYADNNGCTATPITLTAAFTYTLSTNDFTAGGGDGYPKFPGRYTSDGVTLDELVAQYISATTPISPTITITTARINCQDGNGTPNAVPCPVITYDP